VKKFGNVWNWNCLNRENVIYSYQQETKRLRSRHLVSADMLATKSGSGEAGRQERSE